MNRKKLCVSVSLFAGFVAYAEKVALNNDTADMMTIEQKNNQKSFSLAPEEHLTVATEGEKVNLVLTHLCDNEPRERVHVTRNDIPSAQNQHITLDVSDILLRELPDNTKEFFTLELLKSAE